MNAIFAVNLCNGFGTGADMPWPRVSADLKRFKKLTTGHTVVMGAKTWLSNMPKPLPGRRNCVLSSSLVDSRCEVFHSVQKLLDGVKNDPVVFVIGGAQLLWSLLPNIDQVYLTTINSAQTCQITLDVQKYLTGFELTSGEIMVDHKFEFWQKIV